MERKTESPVWELLLEICTEMDLHEYNKIAKEHNERVNKMAREYNFTKNGIELLNVCKEFMNACHKGKDFNTVMVNARNAIAKYEKQNDSATCRCNNCMTIYEEDITTCPNCKTNKYLMQPYEDIKEIKDTKRGYDIQEKLWYAIEDTNELLREFKEQSKGKNNE